MEREAQKSEGKANLKMRKMLIKKERKKRMRKMLIKKERKKRMRKM